MKRIITEISKIKDIPYMIFYKEDGKKLPLVIICHGFNCDKYTSATMAIKLAEKGFCAITFDSSKHGERYDGFLDNITCDADFGTALYSIIRDTYTDISIIVNGMSNDPRIDTSKIGLTGGSMGAMATYYALTKSRDIKVAVPIIGTPDFVSSLMYGMEKEDECQFASPEEKKVLEFVKELDPYQHLIENENRPLLIINASKDDDVPPQRSIDFYNEIKVRYEKEGIPIEQFIADEFHFMSQEMIDKAVDWFEKYLN
ncbi:alpha/beta hydrolase [Alkalicella caledoniensis]|uniref:Alpha/beta hydrolase n=1 Tax=Alkalicella caledoniensis TaxID=2731377 RepID=A0A7G9W6F6_ALKCA|nr:alpha/beta hydrolase [Alkalicella caledoniensis]QNO14268.1 alpha/beta hydrolase [Alkalicella caledoniensis]